MRIRVRLFAMQRELAGAREVALELPAGATIEDAWTALVARHAVLAPGRASIRFARNAAYAAPDTPLADGDEVAMIPPVSGGSPATPGSDAVDPERADLKRPGSERADLERAGPVPTDPEPTSRERPGPERPSTILELREAPFEANLLSELARRLATPEDGAVVGFLGVTRSSPGTPVPGQEEMAARHAARAVDALEYEAHGAMALAVLQTIAAEIRERFDVQRLAIVHRVGEVPLGEPSVAIVTCAPHRGAAFDAARYAIDETKARAPIWKAERFADGHVWIGEPARDAPTA
jgi:MoaE-MoaD fusion protein